MSNFLNQIANRFGLSGSDLEDKASEILDKYRDKIPDNIEDGIDDALHGDMLDELKAKFAPEGSMIDGVLDRFGLGDTAVVEEESSSEEAEETPEEATEESEEESSDEASEEETQ